MFVDDLVVFWVFLFVSALALFIILSHVSVPKSYSLDLLVLLSICQIPASLCPL